MKPILPAVLLLAALPALATEWVEVGADTEAKYYVDVDSIQVDGDNVRVVKKGIYTHPLTDSFDGKSATFRETRGIVEIDCGRRINRITRIDMLGEDGAVVWSSGPLPRQSWEEVRSQGHSWNTLELVCSRLRRT
jgi:hypothetical protein